MCLSKFVTKYKNVNEINKATTKSQIKFSSLDNIFSYFLSYRVYGTVEKKVLRKNLF